MTTPAHPAKLGDVVTGLLDNGWSFFVQHGKDTGNHPFISIEARRGIEDVRITWHTRAAGTYRLFSCMAKKRDVPLTKAMECIHAELPAPPEVDKAQTDALELLEQS